MGVCASDDFGLTPEQRDHDRRLDDRLKEDNRKESLVHKLLLLGAGESGKSTLFKQMTTIYGKGFPPEERKKFRPVIHSNTISAMQILCKNSDILYKKGKAGGDKEHEACGMVDEKSIACKNKIMALRPLDDPLTKDICESMKIVWADPNIQNTYKFRGRFSLPDSADYFFSRLDITWQPDYVPTLADVLRSRVRTTGILEQKYSHREAEFNLFDVGGQRNERKKWIHLFENVTAVIFVASLSGYDQLLYEDGEVNRMYESIRLFEEICNLRWFTRTNMILFLNKSDLFQKKIQDDVKLSACFPEYKGDNSFEDASKYIRDQFEVKNKDLRKQVYTHLTNALDTDKITVVFNTCQDIIIRKSLEQAGLLMS